MNLFAFCLLSLLGSTKMAQFGFLKTYRLLWVALPLLVALAFPSLKDYMAIAAIVLGIGFLWLCWTTRRMGKS
jgi:hypothetical protein